MFLNFYDTSGSFNAVTFAEIPPLRGGFESDNQTVGLYRAGGHRTARFRARRPHPPPPARLTPGRPRVSVPGRRLREPRPPPRRR